MSKTTAFGSVTEAKLNDIYLEYPEKTPHFNEKMNTVFLLLKYN